MIPCMQFTAPAAVAWDANENKSCVSTQWHLPPHSNSCAPVPVEAWYMCCECHTEALHQSLTSLFADAVVSSLHNHLQDSTHKSVVV